MHERGLADGSDQRDVVRSGDVASGVESLPCAEPGHQRLALEHLLRVYLKDLLAEQLQVGRFSRRSRPFAVLQELGLGALEQCQRRRLGDGSHRQRIAGRMPATSWNTEARSAA